MSRLFSLADWRLAAAGVLAGLFTAGLVLLVWIRSIGGGPGVAQLPAYPARSGAEGAFVGALRRQISERLTNRPVPRRPLTGPLEFVARDVVWRDPGTGQPFARSASISGTIDAAAANRGDIVLGTVVMEQPRIELRTDGRVWNYERPMAGLLSEDGGSEGERAVTFMIAALRLNRGTVVVDMPENDFTLNDVEASLATVQFSGPGLAAPRLDVFGATASLLMAGRDRAWALAAERGQLSFPDRTTRFDLSAVTVAGTRIEGLEGVWDPAAPGYGVTATGRAPAVQLADLQFLAPERLPEEGTATFNFALEPRAGDGTAIEVSDLSFSSGDARATGSLAVEVFPGQLAVERVALRLDAVGLALLEPFTGPLPYTGTLTGTLEGAGTDIRLDVLASLRAAGVAQQFATRITGGVAMTRAGLTLEDLKAELRRVPLEALRALAPGLPLAGEATGTFTLTGSPASTPLRLDMRLELGTGLATVAGTVDLTDSIPRYDVTGRLIGIDLQSVLAPAVPPVALSGQFALAGTGFDPATAQARIRIDGGFTGWRAEPGDTIALVASVDAGVVQVDTLAARLASAALGGAGSWRFSEPASGEVHYRLAVADLAPFGPFLPVVGDSVAAGSLEAEGTVSGPLANLRFAGAVTGTGLRSGEWGAGELEAEYAIALTEAVPEVELTLRSTAVTTSTAGDYEQLTADVTLVSSVLTVALQGQQENGFEVAIGGEGTIPREGVRTVLLQRAHFDLPEGRWELASGPARITWGGDDGLRVSSLLLRNAQTAGELSVDGRIFPLDRIDGRVVIAALPLDQVQALLGRDQEITGRLWADLSLRPPGASPTVQGTFRLEQASIEGVAFSLLEGRLDYAGGAARTEFTADFDSAAGRLQLEGTLPLRIAFTDSLEVGLSEGGELNASLRADRVAIRPLRLFVPRVRDLVGFLDGTVTLAGTVEAPSLTGQLVLSDGLVNIPQLNQPFDSIGGIIAFSGRTAEIRDLRAHRDGWVRMNGTAVFEELDHPVLDLVADLDGFQPIGVDEHPDASFSGRVTVMGEPNSLVLSGRVLIDDGYLVLPQLGASYNPAYLDQIDPSPVLGREFGDGGSWTSNARIAGLVAVFGEGAWVEAFQATLQLSGQLTVDKTGDELRLTGTLTGERGTYTLAAGPILRRFEITNAQVRFLGSPEPNPAINVTARRIILDPDGRRVEVEVRITGTAQTPRLALASADAPNIPESELLSFLLFGRPSFALGESFATAGGAVFEQTFFGGIAEFAGLELERALATNFGLQLDLFQVRFAQGFGGLTTPTFVVGRQVSNDFFVTVESGLSALFGDGGGAANTWALRLEWAIDPRQTLQLGSEPLNRARLLRGIGAALPPGRPSQQQLYAEYRRRWGY